MVFIYIKAGWQFFPEFHHLTPS